MKGRGESAREQSSEDETETRFRTDDARTGCDVDKKAHGHEVGRHDYISNSRCLFTSTA